MTQRVIKFRAWDGEKMHWLDFPWNDHWYNSPKGGQASLDNTNKAAGKLYSHGQLILMLFTGRLDKHEKEIYHNDFIKSKGGDIMLVVWRADLASFALRKKGWAYDHYFGEAVDAGDTEIIGNIYTNPELIENGNSQPW